MAAAVIERAPRTRVLAVASSLLTPLLTKRSSHLAILGISANLTWLSLDGESLTIQSIPPDSRLALPTSIFLQETPLAGGFSLHDGQLSLGGTALQITRWWHPPRARVGDWTGTFGSTPEVEVLLGRGAGLTPEGDDLVAGWLVAARSIGHPNFESVRALVLDMSAANTTSFSAALLQCAGAGYGVSPLVDYVNSCLANAEDASAARLRLMQVGHTSGEALAIGVEMAFNLVGKQINFPSINDQERAIAQ